MRKPVVRKVLMRKLSTDGATLDMLKCHRNQFILVKLYSIGSQNGRFSSSFINVNYFVEQVFIFDLGIRKITL